MIAKVGVCAKGMSASIALNGNSEISSIARGAFFKTCHVCGTNRNAG